MWRALAQGEDFTSEALCRQRARDERSESVGEACGFRGAVSVVWSRQ